jgi:hypothetical protein
MNRKRKLEHTFLELMMQGEHKYVQGQPGFTGEKNTSIIFKLRKKDIFQML